MTATILLFDPTAPAGSAVKPLHDGGLDLAGAVVGFIDNAKPNFHHLVDDLADILQRRYGVARVVKQRKTSASIPADPAVIAALSGECDVVIAGSGD
jgi:hypothetical protein